MSARKLLRLVLLVVFAVLLWRRLPLLSVPRIGGSLLPCVALVLLVLVAWSRILQRTFRKPRNLRDEVPKRPLGLE